MPAYSPTSINFAPDDNLWVSRAPLQQTLSLFHDPVRWVGKDENRRPRGLMNPYVITMKQVDASAVMDGGEPTSDVIIQGIDGTNLVTIYPAPSSPGVLLDQMRTNPAGGLPLGIGEFDVEEEKDFARWADTLTNQTVNGLRETFMNLNLYVTVCVDEGRAYIHFPVWKKKDGQSKIEALMERSLHISFFHYIAATDPEFLLDVLRTGTLHFEDEDGDAISPQFYKNEEGNLTLAAAAADAVQELKFEKPAKPIPIYIIGEADSDLEACEMLVAKYHQGLITYEEAYCKIYK